jgi:hypothetical protein
MKWGLSAADWHDHAVNDHGDYPGGSRQALCGHWFMVITPLRNQSCGTQCEACVTALGSTNTSPCQLASADSAEAKAPP